MSRQEEKGRQELGEILDGIFEEFPSIRSIDIPCIDLYMDQVTTFLQDGLRSLSRDPAGDKFLTKTMINNYVKNKVILPPVKKKYSREHMMLLIMVYYMKSFLSISDIRTITSPVMEFCAGTPGEDAGKGKGGAGYSISDLYETISAGMKKQLPTIRSEIEEQIRLSGTDFADAPQQERTFLQRFSLICRLSAEVYMRKLFIEKLLDSGF